MLIAGVHRVFVDSNVLYSRTLRDWLGLLYLQGERSVFTVFWSEDVLAEALRTLRKKHPEWDGGKISTIRQHIAGTFEVGRVDNFVVDGSYTGPDPHDAHVHGAAVACCADFLLTCNVAHFPETPEYEVITPDDFFCLMDDVAPALVTDVVREQAQYWGRKRGEADLVGNLERAQAFKFADRVHRHLKTIALKG
ncbi:MAG: PIN domain-containing protein [Phycicoccus sp.]